MSDDRAATVAAEYLGSLPQGIRLPVGPKRPRPKIAFAEFRQVVRRHRPSVLLPVLGSLATHTHDAGLPAVESPALMYAPPWAIATAARESLLWGNEHRSDDLSSNDLRALINAFWNVYDSRTDHDKGLLSIVTRHAYEQFPYQESIFEELSRSHAMLVEGLDDVECEVLGADAWESLLGAPLGQAVGATFFLHVAAMTDNGWFDPALLKRDDLGAVFDLWPKEAIRTRLEALSSTTEEFKACLLYTSCWGDTNASAYITIEAYRYVSPRPSVGSALYRFVTASQRSLTGTGQAYREPLCGHGSCRLLVAVVSPGVAGVLAVSPNLFIPELTSKPVSTLHFVDRSLAPLSLIHI